MTDAQIQQKKDLESKKASGEELSASDLATLDALKSLEDAEAKLKKQSERNDDVQKLLSKQGQELGEIRKKLETIETTSGKSPPKDGDDDEDKAKEAQAKAQADSLQAEIATTEEGRKILDEAWDKLSPAQQSQLDKDVMFRLKFYQLAKSQLPNPAVRKPWSTSGSDKGGGNDDDLESVFTRKDGREAPKKESSADSKKDDKTPDPMYSEAGLVVDTRTK